jgi:Uma2 family endonuclease
VTRSVPAAAAWDVVPNIAIEIVSPTDRLSRHINKLEEYFAAGVQRVWVVFPDQCKVYVYDSPTSVRILQVGDDLTAEPVLTGFQLPLATLFETEGDGTTATV